MNNKDIILKYALSHLGVPYLFGGCNRLTGLDCSQFVIECLIAGGLLPNKYDNTAQGLMSYFAPYKTQTPSELALVFYGIVPGAATHVALCLNDKLMIEAGGGDSKVLTLDDAKNRSALIRIRPIDFRKDLLGYALPPW